ncbi:protein translocase subunit SecD [Alicyclobacillus tolerans]|uniref:Protein translocase subunit SecD n=2 Tax=Alicyclobacillus tolerans TaxID=90970 RepID=A0A1M6K9M9_9BACL|nr:MULTISPECIES: protein translocase subunit SecD [Alicyclobacillus]MDP9727272.1 SecD/SecF fusion protein [Alicyclobacillus tengchongensis]QRF23025.1 protein translocase subunit SecD [Alicyclobacillus sp. TC]SHJ55655.1 SecD/SecF fusion protein [Alicyclobacillus montanus]
MKWSRFGSFLLIAVIIIGLAAGTTMKLWRQIPLGLDLKGGISLLYKIEPVNNEPLTQAGIEAALQAVETRVNSLGVSSPQINLENGNEISVQLAGAFNQAQAEQIIGETAVLQIYGNIKMGKDNKPVPVPGTLLITGRDMESNATAGLDSTTGQPVVDVTFKNKALWAKITKEYLGKTVYTFLNGNLIQSATVQSVIENGQTQISGVGSMQQAQQLAKELNAGSLPYPLKQIASTNVGPQLGAASLRATLYAGLVAIVLIFLFMIAIYRLAGLIADIAIIAYAYLTLLVFAGFPITLTLPGLAALILGMGIAVDANIITYERIKDEVRNGRSLQSATIAGSKRALRTILDSNATTFIAGLVMFWFGQGDVRGFAIALMVSIIVSLLTAVFLSRTMLLQLTKSNLFRNPAWYGARKGGAGK